MDMAEGPKSEVVNCQGAGVEDLYVSDVCMGQVL